MNGIVKRRFPRDMRRLYELLDTLDDASLAALRREGGIVERIEKLVKAAHVAGKAPLHDTVHPRSATRRGGGRKRMTRAAQRGPRPVSRAPAPAPSRGP